MAVAGLVREVRSDATFQGPIVVAGAGGLADVLRKELVRGGDERAVRMGGVDGAGAVVYVLAAPPTEDDARVLRQASQAKIPVVCVLAGPELEADVPHVLATDVVRVPAGSGFPVEEIAALLAARLAEKGTALAARLPVFRGALTERLVERASLRAGLVGVAAWIPGAELPVLTLLQIRLVLRLAACYGREVGPQLVPEIVAVMAAGIGLRGVARRALRTLPLPHVAVRGGVAYGGTRAVGEAAIRYFEARSRAEI
jgi:uncharacterized protein (DUF697 family)